MIRPLVTGFIAVDLHPCRGFGLYRDLFDFELRLGWITLILSRGSISGDWRRALDHLSRTREVMGQGDGL